jgi:hypothetical protein
MTPVRKKSQEVRSAILFSGEMNKLKADKEVSDDSRPVSI